MQLSEEIAGNRNRSPSMSFKVNDLYYNCCARNYSFSWFIHKDEFYNVTYEAWVRQKACRTRTGVLHSTSSFVTEFSSSRGVLIIHPMHTLVRKILPFI